MTLSRAIFTPAVSHGYAKLIGAPTENFRNGNWPNGMTAGDLDFLNPKTEFFKTKAYLISAGQFLNKGMDHYPNYQEVIDLTIIGDSGGFQIINNPEWYQGYSTVKDVLSWQEKHCDVAPIIDIPTGCVDEGNGVFDSVSKCLETTVQNLRWATDNRRSEKLILLNVVQGRDLKSAIHWYDSVREFQIDGWGFGGNTRIDLEVMMMLLIRMRDNGDLEKTRWIHMFGVGTLKGALAYTAVRRGLEAHGERELPVSFDVSTPFTSAYKRRAVKGLPKISTDKLSLPEIQGLDSPQFAGSLTRFPLPITEISKRMTVGDICVNGNIHLDHAWDQLSCALVANHNLSAMSLAYEWVNSVYELDASIAAAFLPGWLVEFRDLVPEILKSEKAGTLINKYKSNWSMLQD